MAYILDLISYKSFLYNSLILLMLNYNSIYNIKLMILIIMLIIALINKFYMMHWRMHVKIMLFGFSQNYNFSNHIW